MRHVLKKRQMKIQFSNNIGFWNIKKNLFKQFCNFARLANCEILHNYKNKLDIGTYPINFVSSAIISEIQDNNRHLEVASSNLSSLERMFPDN